MTPTGESPPQIRLHCCPGQPAPAPVVEGWNHFRGLPDDARRAFWTLLRQVLESPANARNPELAQAFAEKTNQDANVVIAALQGCEFLIRQASALDLDAPTFQQDLTALSDGDLRPAETILSQYEATKVELRQGSYHQSLADHGKLLLALNWRLDRVVSSDRGSNLNGDVIYLTLVYREGESLDRVTLQLTPQAMKDLKGFCNRFEG